MKKLLTLLYTKTSIGFAFWFIIGTSTTLLFYKPFQQPILFDRAYLLYMSQVVFRGDSLYHSTTFGYTPFSTIVVGLLMKVGSLLSFDTITSARVIGVLMYGVISGSFYVLSKSIIQSKLAHLSVAFFCGLGYIQMLSGVNAEPKIWVLLFSILGIYSFNKDQWIQVGLYFSLAAMSWHVAVISLFACTVMLPWRSKLLLSTFSKLMLGVVIGVLPVLIYLYLTNGWIDFWNQAILRKLIVEGSSVGESPFMWIEKGVYPYFLLESFHFIFGAVGIFLFIYALFKKQSLTDSINKRSLLFLVVYCLLWALFNSLDFQTCVDLLPLIPPIVIFCSYFLITVLKKLKNKFLASGLVLVLLFYNFIDATIYELPYSFSDQEKTINQISEKYKKVFLIGFEEYCVVREEPMPTKFMRYSSYEDHMIDNAEMGCVGIGQLILNNGFDAIIAIDRSKRIRSETTQKLTSNFQKHRVFENYKNSKCATYLIDNLTRSNEIDSLSMVIQSVPLTGAFYTTEYYSVFEVTNGYNER